MTLKRELWGLRWWPLAWPMVITFRLADLAADAGDHRLQFERGAVVILLGAIVFVPLLLPLVLIQVPILAFKLLMLR